MAKEQGLTTFGTITVLEFGAQKGLLELRTSLHNLCLTTFRISREHVEAALAKEAARKWQP